MWIYEEIYKMLEELTEGFQFMPNYLKLKAPGFMDYLNVDKLRVDIIALSRYYQNSSGHRIVDPDMEIKLDHQNKTAEALTYQDSFTFRDAYPEPGKIDLKAKKELNEFLLQWLKALKEQGYRVVKEEKR
jgi:hypothetical protein